MRDRVSAADRHENAAVERLLRQVYDELYAPLGDIRSKDAAFAVRAVLDQVHDWAEYLRQCTVPDTRN
jgi:hypothetical protein